MVSLEKIKNKNIKPEQLMKIPVSFWNSYRNNI